MATLCVALDGQKVPIGIDQLNPLLECKDSFLLGLKAVLQLSGKLQEKHSNEIPSKDSIQPLRVSPPPHPPPNRHTHMDTPVQWQKGFEIQELTAPMTSLHLHPIIILFCNITFATDLATGTYLSYAHAT